MYSSCIEWDVPFIMFGIIKLYGDVVGGNGDRDHYKLIGDGHFHFGLGGVEALVCGIALWNVSLVHNTRK